MKDRAWRVGEGESLEEEALDEDPTSQSSVVDVESSGDEGITGRHYKLCLVLIEV